MLKPCAVIPYYNHPQTIVFVVESIVSYGLSCVVVNDGSDAESTAALDALLELDDVTVVHHEQNQGKGGAVKTGLRWVYEQGYTHALQVDADAQHNLDDIPRFLEEAKANPEALILGKPVFDETVPMGRYLARYITHVWVWIETLSLHVKDTMCGYRMYPMSQVMSLLETTRLGDRMDFDIEIVVRMYWRWTRIIHLDTKVTYGGPGGSHFQPLQDNVLISWLHTRLFFGMLLRLPKLLFKLGRKRAQAPNDWLSMQERGATWGIRITLWTYSVLGRRICSALVHVIIFYFFLVARGARAASRKYLNRLYEHSDKAKQSLGKRPGFWSGYQHFLAFGLAALDKFAAWMGKISLDDIDTQEIEKLRDVVRQGQGVVMLGSHFGNLEVLRALRHDSSFKVNALMLVSNAARFNRILKEVHPGMDMNIIPAESIGSDTAILLKDKIEQGEIVALLADRMTPDSRHRYSEVPFLGHPAPLPHGPMILASLMECPVFLLFVTSTGPGKYKIHCELFSEQLKFQRKHRNEQIKDVVEQYAQRLEAHCEMAPYQWFNFYDFWAKPVSKLEKKRTVG